MTSLDTDSMTRYKCVVVGDDSVGKTSLLISYATRAFPDTVVPDLFDNYAGSVIISGTPQSLSLIDTSKQIDSEGLRSHLYQGTDIFLVCFSVVRPQSLEGVEQRWLPEIKNNFPDVPIVVIGTQTDLRTDPLITRLLSNQSRAPMTHEEGQAFARRLGAKYYIETSPYEQRKLKPVLTKVIEDALTARNGIPRRRGNTNCKIM